MIRDNLLTLLTDLIYFGIPNGWFVYAARKRKSGIAKLRLKQYEHLIFLRCGSSDFIVFDQVFKSREYNIELPVEENEVIIDAGANIGLASIYLLHKFPTSKIIALEPEAKNYELLIKNTQHYSKIACLRKALWSSRVNLFLEDRDKNYWGFSITNTPTESKVEAVSVSDLISEFKLNGIAVLKLDIEGSEKEIFSQGWQDWLPSVRTIVIELHDFIHPGTAHAFFSAIFQHSYSISIKGEKVVARRQTN